MLNRATVQNFPKCPFFQIVPSNWAILSNSLLSSKRARRVEWPPTGSTILVCVLENKVTSIGLMLGKNMPCWAKTCPVAFFPTTFTYVVRNSTSPVGYGIQACMLDCCFSALLRTLETLAEKSMKGGFSSVRHVVTLNPDALGFCGSFNPCKSVLSSQSYFRAKTV